MNDISRRPKTSPNRTRPELEHLILEAAAEHPFWGARKLRTHLLNQGVTGLPTTSTFVEVFKRGGITRQVPVPPGPWQRFEHPAPMDLVQMDFKGHFPVQKGRCHPLTMLDDHSRFCLAVESCADEREATVKAVLKRTFQRYGLPGVILCDNGSPWGSGGGNQLTALEIWLMKQGIQMSHGRAYHPQTQGKLERFHRTLKLEALQGRVFQNLEQCQLAFDQFRHKYNTIRPHEGIEMLTPITRYRPSERSYNPSPVEPEYPDNYIVRKVHEPGRVYFEGRTPRVSKSLIGEHVGLHQSQEHLVDVYFYAQKIQTIDMRDDENV